MNRRRLLPGTAASILCIALLLVGARPRSTAAQGTNVDPRLEGKISDPAFCPSNRDLVAYARQVEDTQELYLYNARSGTVRQITAADEADEGDGDTVAGFFEGNDQRQLRLFEGQLAWRPVLDSEGRQWFVFVSSAGEGGYGLHLSYLTAEGELADQTIALPFEGQAQHPSWSPDGRKIAFAGSRRDEEGTEIFLHANVRRAFGGDPASAGEAVTQLTDNPAGNLYPDWAPSGQFVAYQSRRRPEGGLANWGISLLDLTRWTPAQGSPPPSIRLSGQLSAYHEYKPSWSPSGQYLAFYVTQSRVGRGGGAQQRDTNGNRQQDIAVLTPVRGSGKRTGGRIQRGAVLEGYTADRLAQNVLPNDSRGPEWHPSPANPSLMFVAKEANKGNPIYLSDLSRWQEDKRPYAEPLSPQFEPSTQLHEQVQATLGPGGLRVAFASQVGEALRLQVRDGLQPTYGAADKPPTMPQEVSRGGALWRSAAFPGWGQLHKGERTRALIFAGAGAVALGATIATIANHQGKVDDYDSFVENKISRDALATLPKSEVDQRFDRLEALYDDTQSAATTRTIAIVALAGVWAWNLYDTYRGFPTYVDRPVYANQSLRVEAPRIGLAPTGDGMSAQFSLRIRF